MENIIWWLAALSIAFVLGAWKLGQLTKEVRELRVCHNQLVDGIGDFTEKIITATKKSSLPPPRKEQEG